MELVGRDSASLIKVHVETRTNGCVGGSKDQIGRAPKAADLAGPLVGRFALANVCPPFWKRHGLRLKQTFDFSDFLTSN